MRLRRERDERGTTVTVGVGDVWVSVRDALDALSPRGRRAVDVRSRDLVDLLAAPRDAQDELVTICRAHGEPFAGDEVLLPFAPRALRCFSEWSAHWEQAARVLARRYHPLGPWARGLIGGYEAVTRRTFPPLRPGREFEEHPVYYLGNHLNVLRDGDELPWPSTCEDLDYELEIGALVVRGLHDATPEEALRAVGGFVVVNDFSSRDTQWREHTGGPFGPVVKTKGFATALGSVVVKPDEVLPWFEELRATVRVNGEEWSSTTPAGMRNGIAAMAAWASAGEAVHPGELLSTGTLPRGSGIELDRRLREGDTVTFEVERIGTLTTTIGRRPRTPA